MMNLRRKFKNAKDHGLVLRKTHRLIEINRTVQLKPYSDMNTDLRQKANNDFEKDFF